ncbi:firmicute transcriptional repressor of class III stress [Phascolarctobacterium succinatutens CAG:287]|uniref:Firmicute transcriptional repressor of class III stress n=1 Tax=Phascolarctobacterium succinatutens CAG:287 TaxID=1263101 RepID=R6WJ45_9FIRM|nr:CtsR family transcriptional regulator [Phascolarctobacterium succinatutens]CDD11138.1 firmicute transcriptional repressor of class III stress [Phascolarctobacterium succinatutens CAG:287]
MKNLADAIESFIIGELLREHENTVLVQRNELAERLSCAPSQISYVISTRFTPERGFMVESRRGSGGFVRIIRMQPAVETPKPPTAMQLVQHLQQQKMITAREGALLQYMLQIIDADEDKKKEILQQAVSLLHSTGRR